MRNKYARLIIVILSLCVIESGMLRNLEIYRQADCDTRSSRDKQEMISQDEVKQRVDGSRQVESQDGWTAPSRKQKAKNPAQRVRRIISRERKGEFIVHVSANQE
jgi:hypothetical protein